MLLTHPEFSFAVSAAIGNLYNIVGTQNISSSAKDQANQELELLTNLIKKEGFKAGELTTIIETNKDRLPLFCKLQASALEKNLTYDIAAINLSISKPETETKRDKLSHSETLLSRRSLSSVIEI